MYQLGAGIVPANGQTLSPWVGTLGWVARNLEAGSDDSAGRVEGRRADRDGGGSRGSQLVQR